MKSVMDEVVRDRMPVVISRRSGEAVFMALFEDWNAAEEMIHLLARTTNAWPVSRGY